MNTKRSLYLKKVEEVYSTSLRHPEDCYKEYVRDVAVGLYEHADEEDGDDEGLSKEPVGRLFGTLIRQSRRGDEVDIWTMADAHSGEAEHVCSYLIHGIDEHDFFGSFDTIALLANVLLIEEINWPHASTEQVRLFARRAIDQFEVDLVMIYRDDEVAAHFKNFFDVFEDGPMANRSREVDDRAYDHESRR